MRAVFGDDRRQGYIRFSSMNHFSGVSRVDTGGWTTTRHGLAAAPFTQKNSDTSPATFALSNVARVPTTGCVRFIDYFDCYAGDSAAPAFVTPKFLPRISFPNAPFAISPEVFPLLFRSMGIFLRRTTGYFHRTIRCTCVYDTYADRRNEKRTKREKKGKTQRKGKE